MPYFNRFDICEAYLALEWNYHVGGWLRERPSNQRRKESTERQLCRMEFAPGGGFCGYESLSENGREIYAVLCERYGFKDDEDTESDVCVSCGVVMLKTALEKSNIHDPSCPFFAEASDA